MEPLPSVPAFRSLEGPRPTPQARAGDKLKDASQQFEAIFLRQILKDLRKTAKVDEESSSMTGIYNDMFDEQLADHLARTGGFGLAGVIQKYLEGGKR